VSLKGKKGLIVGIANRNSIAYGCAEVLHGAGAELAVTYLNAKAEPFVRPLAERLGNPIVVPCDVREAGQLEAVFSRIQKEWGRLDFLLHSIAYARKICTAVLPIAPKPGSQWRWTYRATLSSAWRGWRSLS
jgi:enoyl-[acyl-carrier protein] reductase I